jgi:FKBP-type peptidyl-prolyl cis-trans isomerase
VHCTGYGKNKDLAVPFWSTKDAGQQPFEFVIGQGSVIKAWDEGVATMKVIAYIDYLLRRLSIAFVLHVHYVWLLPCSTVRSSLMNAHKLMFCTLIMF